MAPQRGGRFMFLIVEAIHKALRTESTLVFVLVIAGVFAVGGGAVAWLVDKGYKNSPEYREEHGSLTTGRRLEEWQKVRMVAMLSPHSGQHVVILASAGEETSTYANQFRDVFSASKWRVDGPKPAPPDQPALDLQISVSGQFFGHELPAAYQAVRGALQFTGMKMRPTYIADPDIKPDVIVLWVGPKSPDSMEPGNYPPLVTHGHY